MRRRRKRTRAPLPPPCRECRGQDGAWRLSETGGLERCYCDRGEELKRRAQGDTRGPRVPQPAPFDHGKAASGDDS